MTCKKLQMWLWIPLTFSENVLISPSIYSSSLNLPNYLFHSSRKWWVSSLVSYLILLCDMEGRRIASSNQDEVALGRDYDVFHFNLYSFLSHSSCSICVFDKHWSLNGYCWANTVTSRFPSVIVIASLELVIAVYIVTTMFTLCFILCLSTFNFIYHFIAQSFSIVKSSYSQF